MSEPIDTQGLVGDVNESPVPPTKTMRVEMTLPALKLMAFIELLKKRDPKIMALMREHKVRRFEGIDLAEDGGPVPGQNL